MKIKSKSRLVRYVTEYDNGWVQIQEIYDPHLSEEIGIYDLRVNGEERK